MAQRRLRLGVIAVAVPITTVASVAAAGPGFGVPGWSRFPDSGIAFDSNQTGPLCVLSAQTADGPRLFVGGQFSGVYARGSSSVIPMRGIVAWDGAQWSGVQGGVPSIVDDPQVLAITTTPIGGVSRVVLAGFFEAPQTGVGIGYLDDGPALRPLIAGPIQSAWFAGAYGWTPPAPLGGQAAPEIVVTSGLFPEGSDYAYRYTPSAVALMPPGLVSVTNAFAEFDDGAGRALYIGMQRNGSGPDEPLSRWDGTTLTSVDPGLLGGITAICVHDDGGGPALYVAGQGLRRYKAGVWETVGGQGAPTFNINALASFDDGSGPALYAAGQFTVQVPGAATTTNIVRFRNGVWEALGSGLGGGRVSAMAVFDEDGPGPRQPGLYVVGKFTTADGASSIGIARWGSPACRADYNNSGGVTVQDIFDFLGDWFSGSPRADFGGGLSVQSIFDFLSAWFSGC